MTLYFWEMKKWQAFTALAREGVGGHDALLVLTPFRLGRV